MTDQRPSSGQQALLIHAEKFQGPLPPPSILEGYERIVPGSAERIISLLEKQTAHRQSLETKIVNGGKTRSDWGLVCGAVITLVVIFVSAYLILKGHDWAGSTLVTIDLGSILTAFIYGTNKNQQERIEKHGMLEKAQRGRKR